MGTDFLLRATEKSQKKDQWSPVREEGDMKNST